MMNNGEQFNDFLAKLKVDLEILYEATTDREKEYMKTCLAMVTTMIQNELFKDAIIFVAYRLLEEFPELFMRIAMDVFNAESTLSDEADEEVSN